MYGSRALGLEFCARAWYAFGMRSVFIHNQVEFRVEVPKDSLCQGDVTSVNFVLKNRASADQALEGVALLLGSGDPQGVQEGKHFDIVQTFQAPTAIALSAGAEHRESFHWELSVNACVSSKGDSLFFRFGVAPQNLQSAPIQVGPHPHIEAIHSLLESSFQFGKKAVKSSKGWVEAKFKPSSARRFAMVEELNFRTYIDGSQLKINCVFKVKRFQGVDATSVKVGKAKVEVQRSMEQSQYLMGGTHLNNSAVEDCIESALKEVASAI
ncbi:MAG: hypothetical protein K1X79_03730 [Oligoflexia bacterium]|nr:hypothetical protein [Oligoflexia bacterium]